MRRLPIEELEKFQGVPFSTADLKTELSDYTALKMKMSRLVKEGVLVRLRRDFFCLSREYSEKLIEPGVIANAMYGPSYVSFETALSFYGLIPERTYLTMSAVIRHGKYFKTHPEYFAMKNGKRVLGSEEGYSELCISNPEVRKLLVSHIVSEFDAGADVVELGQQDSGGYCECENCRAYGGPEAKTVGEKYWIFHRSIAEELYKLRPGKTVQITSYRQTDCTPSSFREFPPNVMVELMT